MKKLIATMAAALVIAAALMVGIHWQSHREVRRKLDQIDMLSDRQKTAESVVLEFERYRRMSSEFRRIGPAESEAAKARLRSRFAEGMKKLELLQPTEDDRALSSKTARQMDEFTATAEQLEPTLFSKDIYNKQKARDFHDAVVGSLTLMAKKASERANALRPEVEAYSRRSMQLVTISAGAIAGLILLILLAQYLVFSRPLRKLRNFPEQTGKLRGAFGDIQGKLNELTQSLEALRKERQQFITAIAADLRVPLVGLQAGAAFLASPHGDTEQRGQALDVIMRSAERFSRALDDLTDIVDLDRGEIRLDEKVVDLGMLADRIGNLMGGPGSPYRITTHLPAVPLWTLVDSTRMERVLINMITKTMSYLPQGSEISVAVTRPSHGAFRGVEIHVQEGVRQPNRGSSGPEQDVLKHWASDNGFGMALAHKIVKGHGGTLTAAGLKGTGLHFTVRLPQERVATGWVPSVESVVRTPGLEGSRIKTMLPEQAVNFRA